jgi:hypothetical protein
MLAGDYNAVTAPADMTGAMSRRDEERRARLDGGINPNKPQKEVTGAEKLLATHSTAQQPRSNYSQAPSGSSRSFRLNVPPCLVIFAPGVG